MKRLTAYLLICIVHISVFAEQQIISNDALLASSESLASEMGRTFQLAQNCQQDMSNISAHSAAKLFRNYFEEREVEMIMRQYKLQVVQGKGKLCDREKIKFYILMNKMAVYMREARSLIKK